MQNNNRPEGRKRRIEGTGSGLYRRGEGLNTGPVGKGQSAAPKKVVQQFTGNGGGGNYRGKRGGGGGIGIIAIILLLLFGGGGGALSGLFGGGSSSTQTQEQTVYVTPAPKPSAAVQTPAQSGGLGSILQQGLSGGSVQSDWKEPANVQTVSATVASGARDKFTTIRGNGQDVVTVMVYMCGTDLEAKGGMATKDLLEMTRATIGNNVNIIVYTGGCTRWNNNVISTRTNQIYQVVSGNLKVLNSNAGNVSMTDPNTLASFISYCAKNFAANRYELIFWDHGGGSVSGYGYDQKFSSSGSMTLAGIKQALDKAKVTFDFIGFDACLMGTLENGLMLSNRADYLIASEETEPGTGWYYTNWITALSKNTSISTLDLGKMIVDDFVAACAQGTPGQSATLSVVDLAELSYTVPPAFKAFSESLSGMIADQEYAQISTARSNTREFARSTAIDQIDLVHFASNIGNAEGKALSQAVLGAVKYNRTSSNMNNSYGVSIYFPYRKLSNVDKAIKTYDAIGLDESYSQCIREFASLETAGQYSTGGYGTNPYGSLFGDLSQYGLYGSYGSASGSTGYGSSSGSSSGYGSYSSMDSTELIGSLLEAFLGSGSSASSSSSPYGSMDFLFGRSLNTADTAAYIADNLFDPAALVWTKNAAGEDVLVLSEDQWALVNELELDMFFDDGKGFVELGRDNIFEFDDDGALLAPQELAWVTIDGQFAPYYHEYTTGSGSGRVDTGYVPALVNGERAELLLSFDAEGYGAVTGVRYVYLNGETETVAKSMTASGEEVDFAAPPAEETGTVGQLKDGDTIDFVCDYYSYDGTYDNSYLFGRQLTVNGELKVTNGYLPGGVGVQMLYRFTDLFGQHYWSLPIEG